MTGYRQNRPERVCETLLALAANAAVSREEALRAVAQVVSPAHDALWGAAKLAEEAAGESEVRP